MFFLLLMGSQCREYGDYVVIHIHVFMIGQLDTQIRLLNAEIYP